MNNHVKFLFAATLSGTLSLAGFGAGLEVKHYSESELKARAEAFQKLPRAEKDKIIAERKAAIAARAGGRIRNTSKQKGRIYVANMQTVASEAAMREAMRRLATHLKVEIVVESVDRKKPAQFKELLAEKKANAIICVGESEDYGSLVIAPDDAWAFVNVKALGKSNVDSRTKKELVRAFAFLCGGASSQFPNPLTRPVPDVRMLDLIDRVELPVDVLGRMPAYLEAMGVTPYIEATYRAACREGWAPQPTNDVQKAIWNEVHHIPENPIKIEYNEKRDKGK